MVVERDDGVTPERGDDPASAGRDLRRRRDVVAAPVRGQRRLRHEDAQPRLQHGRRNVPTPSPDCFSR